VTDLDAIADGAGKVTFGAAVTYAAAAPHLAAIDPDLGELMRRFAGPQVRHLGTIGGNIANASPIGDTPPALIALGGALVLQRGAATRTLPLEDFFIAYGRQDRGPGEFVRAVVVPKLGPDERFRCYKVSRRFDQDISAVMEAFLLRIAGDEVVETRAAFGGMAAIPTRAAAVERALTGRRLDAAAVAAARAALASDFSPISDLRASAGYRMRVAGNLIERLAIEVGDPGARTRLAGAAERSGESVDVEA